MKYRCLFAVAALMLAPWAPLQAADKPAAKPNIVLIFIDDMGYGDIGPFGSTKNRTPNLDRMAKEGMKLTSFYAAPVCSVSRSQVITAVTPFSFSQRNSRRNSARTIASLGNAEKSASSVSSTTRFAPI